MPSSAAFGLPSVPGITYTSISPVDGNQTFLVPIIYTTPIKRVEIQPTWGVFLRWLTTFKIDAATWTAATAPGSAVPKLRDTLLVDGLLWTVHRAVDSPDPLNGLWRLACTSLVIDPTLQDTINILLPVDSTDAAASPITTSQLEPSLTALPCRIQFAREETVDYQGIQFMRAWYQIFVENLEINLPLGTLVVATAGEYSGVTFRVISNDNIEQIDELEMLTCTVDP